ncbi:MAG: response regulator [Aliivibrio sp.]|uniref:response regulator n=1 Tax=Aliivibrio sp. TaxID=1872443 RepID=UPI001A4013BC|nr:response regulator [Aliivibrio sp.]
MPSVLICDDSPLARKSLARYFTESCSVNLHYAENGKEALELLSKQNIDVVFLDLTMPVMDGYQVLSALPVNAYPSKVVIVSGDIQDQAIKRCLNLGAFDFIKKPFCEKIITALFDTLHLEHHCPSSAVNKEIRHLDHISKFKEISNIALGKGAAIISEYSGEFFHMPVPKLKMMSVDQLEAKMDSIFKNSDFSPIAQRFVGSGIHGEALMCLSGSDVSLFGERIGIKIDEGSLNELNIDVSDLLVSSYLVSLSEQLGFSFSLRQPLILDREIREFNNGNGQRRLDVNKEMFAIEYSYKAQNLDLICDVVYLMDVDSLAEIIRIMDTI